MNSNFNNFGRRNVVMGRPLNPGDCIVRGEEKMKAPEFQVITKADAGRYDSADKYDCRDEEMKKPAVVRAPVPVTSVLNTFLQELISKALADVNATAEEEGDELEMTDDAGWEPVSAKASSDYENQLELHGVLSHSLYGKNLSVTLAEDAEIYFNDSLIEDGKVEMTLEGPVEIIMIGEDLDLEMVMYFDAESRLYSPGQYNLGHAKFHSLGLTDIKNTIGYGVGQVAAIPAIPVMPQIQAQTALQGHNQIPTYTTSEPKYDQSYFDKLVSASNADKQGFDSLGQAYCQQPTTQNQRLLMAAFTNDNAWKNVDEAIGVAAMAYGIDYTSESKPVSVVNSNAQVSMRAEVQTWDKSATIPNLIGHAGLCEEIEMPTKGEANGLGLSRDVLNPAVVWSSSSVNVLTA